MHTSERSKPARSLAIIALLGLAIQLCGCHKPDPYAKLDAALARFEAALQRSSPAVNQAEFVEHVAMVRTEWNKVAGKPETVGDFSEGFAKKAWEHLDYSCQTDDFGKADISRGETSVFDLREYLNRLRIKQGSAK